MSISTSSDLSTDAPSRPLGDAIRRGLAHKCPACGKGDLYRHYLDVVERCQECGEALHHHRADDAPPYFTILIVGHLIVAGVLMVEDYFHPAYWIHIAIWFPLTIALSLWLLPRIKGACVGLQWALRMHGFSGPESWEPKVTQRASVAESEHEDAQPQEATKNLA